MRQDIPATAAPPPVAVRSHEAAPPAPAPPPAAPALRPTPASTQYPYVTTELRRIAILAGIMLVILVVLYFVIP